MIKISSTKGTLIRLAALISFPAARKQADRLNIPANESEGARESSGLTATCSRLLAGGKEAQTIGVTGCDNSLEIVTGPVRVITVVVTRRNLVIATSARRDTRARSGHGDFGGAGRREKPEVSEFQRYARLSGIS